MNQKNQSASSVNELPRSRARKKVLMKKQINLLRLSASIFISVFCCLCVSLESDHELGVYSIFEYKEVQVDEINEEGWKSPCGAYDGSCGDPAEKLWNTMTSGTSSEYAHSSSKYRKNDEVNYKTIFPIPNGMKGWDNFDMVFFYGHNNMITPPHECYYGDYFWSNKNGSWERFQGHWCKWGTAMQFYEYYYKDVWTGEVQPGSVTYLWEPFTSVLLGYQFQPDVTSYYQIHAQDAPSGNSKGTYGTFVSGLGTDDLEWLILHGCQGVIVANEDGSKYNNMGKDAFSRTWDGFHIILGHYIGYNPGLMPDLDGFANNLLTGMPIQAAYFLTDPANNSSAISAECNDQQISIDDYLQHHSYMNNDTWTDPMDDIGDISDKFFWGIKWIRQFNALKHWLKGDGGSARDSDLTFLKVMDEKIKEFLGDDRILIRDKDYLLLSGKYPLLMLEEINEEDIKSVLEENILTFSDVRVSENQIKDLNHILSAEIGTRIYWVSKASGAYSFSETDRIMSVPSGIDGPEDAIRIALNYLAELQLIELCEDETLDVVFVSIVMNAAVHEGEEEPFLTYPSDYFVGFGRQYKGIPVIGSYVTLRIGEEGKLLGVQKNWREITGELDETVVEVDESLLLQMATDQLLERGVINKEEDMENVEIIDMYCGYFEGFISNVQHKMGLGCLVNYRYKGSETILQIAFPLADFDFSLLGTQKHIEQSDHPQESTGIIDDIFWDESRAPLYLICAVIIVLIGILIILILIKKKQREKEEYK